MKERVLVVIDMQEDFTTGALGNKDCAEVVEKVAQRMKEAVQQGMKIVCTCDIHPDEEQYMKSNEGRNLPVPHCLKGTKGAELVKEVKQMKDFYLIPPIEKGAFGSIKLAEELKKFDIEEIEMMGVCTDICVISNAMILKAAMPEVKIVINAECCAGVTKESHENALRAMEACQFIIKR